MEQALTHLDVKILFDDFTYHIFRHILRKDNELANLLHQVTYVTATDIKNFATNLQIYESFHISK